MAKLLLERLKNFAADNNGTTSVYDTILQKIRSDSITSELQILLEELFTYSTMFGHSWYIIPNESSPDGKLLQYVVNEDSVYLPKGSIYVENFATAYRYRTRYLSRYIDEGYNDMYLTLFTCQGVKDTYLQSYVVKSVPDAETAYEELRITELKWAERIYTQSMRNLIYAAS